MLAYTLDTDRQTDRQTRLIIKVHSS